jgi:hypothetical protein
MSAAILFDTIKREGAMRFDVELARLIKVKPPELRRLRSGGRPVSNERILIIHEETGMPVKRIRALLAGQDVSKAAPLITAAKPASFVHRCL